MKTAQNVWGKIKGKLAQTAEANKKEGAEEGGEGETNGAAGKYSYHTQLFCDSVQTLTIL